MIDASSLVGALIKSDSIPERALVLARQHDVICMSVAVETEIRHVFARPKFSAAQASGRVDLSLAPSPALGPLIEDVVQVDIGQERRDHRTLRRSRR